MNTVYGDRVITSGWRSNRWHYVVLALASALMCVGLFWMLFVDRLMPEWLLVGLGVACVVVLLDAVEAANQVWRPSNLFHNHYRRLAATHG